MTSEKRILAARANGALSRGPKTPEGKARSAQNALRHGLLSKCVLLRNESRENFQILFNCYVERFAPVDEIEMGLIEEMVASYWRLRRAMTIETHMMDVDMDARASGSELDRLTSSFSDLSGSPKLNVLHRYQTRLHLMHSRALRDLAVMRQKLPQNPPVPNEPNDPAPPLGDSTSACPAEPNSPAEPQASPVPNEPNHPTPPLPAASHSRFGEPDPRPTRALASLTPAAKPHEQIGAFPPDCGCRISESAVMTLERYHGSAKGRACVGFGSAAYEREQKPDDLRTAE